MSSYRRLDFSDVSLYGVTPSIKDKRALLDVTEKALAGGVDAIQMRCKELSDRDLLELGRQIKARCAKFKALFLVNNRPDICLALEADGVHLGQEDLPLAFARELLGHRCLIGASTHSLPQALEAQRHGADYVSCGPLWATPTKPDYEAVGVGLIGLYRAALKIPFVAIGGIDETTLPRVIEAGARSIAVVRALFEAKDPQKTAQIFKERIVSKKVETSV